MVQESSILLEAVTSNESAFWVVAMNEVIESLHKKQTWDLLKLPKDSKTVGLRRSYGWNNLRDCGTRVLCIVGNFHMVLLFICCSIWMTYLLLLKAF
jgi:hypothetical protein